MSVDAELEAILAETAPDRASLAQPFTAEDAARDDRAAAAHEQPLHWNGARLRPYSAWSASATEQIIFFIKKKLAAFADETQMDSALEEYYARAIHLFAHIAALP